MSTLLEQLGWTDNELAKAAQQGNPAALDALIQKYKPLVYKVVWEHRGALRAHISRPDHEIVAEYLAEVVFPEVVDSWDPKRGVDFQGYVGRYGRYILRNALRRWLADTDPAFYFDARTKYLFYPRERSSLGRIDEEELDWRAAKIAKAADLCAGPIRVRKDYFERLALVGANELANDELDPETIEDVLGEDVDILRLRAEGAPWGEIATRLGVHRTTAVRRKDRALIRLYVAAQRAKDQRVADVIAKNLANDNEEESKEKPLSKEEILEELFLMRYILRGGR